MSFFAARRRTASSSTSATTTTTTTTTKAAPAPSRTTSSSSLPLRDAAPLRQSVTAQAHALSSPSAANNRFVTVTRKVSKTGSTNNLKERERENAKLLREREAAAAAREEHQLAKDMASRLQQRQNGSLSKKNKKKAASTSSSSGSDSEPGTASRHQRKRVRSNPSVKGKEREVAHHAAARIHRSSPSSDNDDDDDDDESGELGTPVSDRRLPLLVPRDDIAAPLDDNAPPLPLISGEQLVRDNLSGYSRYFDEIPTETTVTLEYPGSSQPETFLLLRPTVKDQQDYQPIQDIIETIRVVCDYFLTAEQAQTHFKHVQHQSGSLSSGSNNSLSARLSDGPAFPRAPSPLSAAITRDQTPASETGTPEPPSSAGLGVTPVAHKEPLIRTLEKAYNRQKGLLFLSAVEWYNSVMRSLKASGAVHDNIVSMGKTRGIPEVVWTRISGQCYERTVGPRVEELSRYEAFSDNTYGELLPPFVAHIASLTGLKQDSVLVDMGSGVGNCVVQASLATGCKSYGFENQEAASSIASAQVEELRARARLWGVSSGACEVHEADFLASPLVGRALAQADVVLVNNYVFSPATNESLSLLFLDLKDGAKIVSLKPFVHVSGGTEINARNVYSPQSILVQDKPYVYTKGSVSWSDRDGTFYIATVNRDRLKRYLEKMGH